MKNIFRKAAVMAVVTVMTLASYSCSGKDSSSDNAGNLAGGGPAEGVSVSSEDMPYGATVTKLQNDDIPVPIEYDYRYMTEEEGRKLSEYFAAVGLKDADMIAGACYGSYLEHFYSTMNVSNIQDYLMVSYDSLKTYTGEDYEFSFFIVSDVIQNEDVYPYYDELIYSINPDAKIESRKIATMDLYYDTESAKSCSLYNRMGNYIQVCVYQIDGQVYILG
jgi:hypothetical protein rflaF_06591